jgi:hypothetical protein
MNYPNGVVPQTIAEWQTHVTRLLDGAAAPILDTTPVASGGLGHVAISGRTTSSYKSLTEARHLNSVDTLPVTTLLPFQTS